jgi:lipid-A-disaccharide synthase
MRVFMSTGEASGEMSAAALATAMRERAAGVTFCGIGSDRMRAAGFAITAETRGWASIGPVEAVAKVAPLFTVMWKHALALRARPPDLIVLVDFGAFNLRLARTLRLLRCRAPILYYFPPSAWLDRERPARAVARYTRPLTPFAHQRDFYRSLGLDVAYFGHPLVSLVPPRPPRPAPAPDAGTVALLPGSRRGEIERHLYRLVDAFDLLRAARPKLRGILSAADADADRLITAMLRSRGAEDTGRLELVRGSQPALDQADAAWIASGTAVLEAALREVPTVAFYVVSRSQVEIGRRVWSGPHVTLPNIVLGKEIVPELLQEDATPERLATALGRALDDPSEQLRGMRELRPLLGAPDALDRCAAYALDLASGA